jgi:hypothetical protein
MARHLLIGDESAVVYSAGVLAFGSIDIQKESAGTGGATSLVLGDTVAAADRIRIVQGDSTGSGRNIVSPWFYGRDVINWSGASYAGQAAHTSLITPTATEAAGTKEIEVKIVRTDSTTYEDFKFSVSLVASSAVNASGAAILAAYNALTNIPDWLNPTCTGGAPAVTFVGQLTGAVAQSGRTYDEKPAIFEVMVSDNPDVLGAAALQTYPATNGVIDGTPGYGDGEFIRDMEESLMGINSGYYNRVQLPKAPNTNAVVGTNYDVWNIVATKDGSSNSQIHGVDNLIDLSVAITTGSGANALSFENRMNAYLGSVGFGAVTL